MTRVLIIDDEPLACDLIAEYLQPHADMEVVGRCHDGFDGVKAIGIQKPDLVFLDVQMPRLTGLEMLELLEEPPAMIFTTAYDEYALKAFEHNAVDYLLKPFTQQRFNEAVERYRQRPDVSREAVRNMRESMPAESRKPERLVIRDGGRIRIVAFNDVHYLEADGDYVKICTAEGKFMKKKSLTHYEELLPAGQFLRVHRSYLLNIGKVMRVDPYEKSAYVATLDGGGRIPVSRGGYQKLRQWLDS